MQHLLMSNGIHFSIYPVSSLEDIERTCQAQLTGEVVLPTPGFACNQPCTPAKLTNIAA